MEIRTRVKRRMKGKNWAETRIYNHRKSSCCFIRSCIGMNQSCAEREKCVVLEKERRKYVYVRVSTDKGRLYKVSFEEPRGFVYM